MDDFFFDIFAGVLVCALVIFGGTAIFSSVHISTDPGIGEQIGYISEVNNNGIVWKPTEINLINSEPTYGSQTGWEYASSSKEIDDLARKYMRSHEKVIVRYEGQLTVWGWEYSNPEIITNIEPVEGEL